MSVLLKLEGKDILLDALDFTFVKQYCDAHNIVEGKGMRLKLEMFLNDYKHNVLKERLATRGKTK